MVKASSPAATALAAAFQGGQGGQGDGDPAPVQGVGFEGEGQKAQQLSLRGHGADQHGQDATKAAVRACRNAIEFNSVPSVRAVVPGGYANMKLHVQLGVPSGAAVDETRVREVFPYGTVVDVRVDAGGWRARSWISIPTQGDANDDFLICVACVTVGY